MYLPCYTYNKETRYSAYLHFIIRSKKLDYKKSWTITKSIFIEKCWLQNKTAHLIWNKWAFICEYFRGKDSNILYLRKKQTKIVIDVLDSVLPKIKTLPDFNLFITALQAWKPNEYWNRSRTLRTIWKETWTCYKQTVSNRVKRANKLWLTSKHRFIKVWEFTPQISNIYTLNWVTFLYNKILNPLSNLHKRLASENKKKTTQIEIVNRWQMPSSDFYEDYALWLWNEWNKMLTI